MKNASTPFAMIVAAAEWQLQAHYVAELNEYIHKITNMLGIAAIQLPDPLVPEWVILIAAMIAVLAGIVQLVRVVMSVTAAIWRTVLKFVRWLKAPK